MSTAAPAVEPAGPARTSGLAAVIEQTRYVLGENRVTAFAFGLLVVILFEAIFGPYVVPYDPLASDTAAALTAPSAAHWFGTDQLGRDIFSRVIVATRLDTFIAVASVVLVFLMGGLAGIAAVQRPIEVGAHGPAFEGTSGSRLNPGEPGDLAGLDRAVFIGVAPVERILRGVGRRVITATTVERHAARGIAEGLPCAHAVERVRPVA